VVVIVVAALSLEDQIRSTTLKFYAVAATGDDDGRWCHALRYNNNKTADSRSR
jgi:hypothetical protein